MMETNNGDKNYYKALIWSISILALLLLVLFFTLSINVNVKTSSKPEKEVTVTDASVTISRGSGYDTIYTLKDKIVFSNDNNCIVFPNVYNNNKLITACGSFYIKAN